MRANRILMPVGMVAVLWLAGCSGKPALPEGAELKAFAEKARDEAVAACEAKDVKRARQAADRAVAAEEKAVKGAEAAAEADRAAAEDLAREVRAAAREAVKVAELAEEEQALAKKVASLRAKAYRAARGPALKLLFAALGLAVEQAASRGYEALSQREKDAATVAADLVAVLGPGAGPPGGKPDWKAIGAAVSAWGDAPPPRVAELLAVAFYLLGRTDLALWESQLADPAAIEDPRERMACRVLRALVCSASGLPRIAARECDAAIAEDPGDLGAVSGPELLAGVHLLVAALAAQQSDYARADLETMRATQAWPNNPIGVFLTGEVMVAEGKYEKAAVSLENLAAQGGADADPWLIERIQKRAREIRDKKGEAEPLFYDSRFMREAAVHLVWQAAKTAKPAERLKQVIESAKSFGGEFLKSLLGGGGKAGDG